MNCNNNNNNKVRYVSSIRFLRSCTSKYGITYRIPLFDQSFLLWLFHHTLLPSCLTKIVVCVVYQIIMKMQAQGTLNGRGTGLEQSYMDHTVQLLFIVLVCLFCVGSSCLLFVRTTSTCIICSALSLVVALLSASLNSSIVSFSPILLSSSTCT